MSNTIEKRADFSAIRYAQCWEDADVLLTALDIQSHHTCLSIASAGDNTLALLSRAPERVIALDLSSAQLACLELRVAAYRELEHYELLELIGSRPSTQRERLYRRCRPLLSTHARTFWDARTGEIARGIGGAGKFERYFTLFRRRVLPLIHAPQNIQELLRDKPQHERTAFYQQVWNTWRWRALFKLFFSRFVMGRLGRDPEFFKYVEAQVAKQILSRTQYALTVLNPADNPYLQWILTGQHLSALPYALRAENFDSVRANLDRLEIRPQSLEEFLANGTANSIDRFNLSDVFEYVAPNTFQELLHELVRVSRNGARLAYWNMLVPRRRPVAMADELKPLNELANRLFAQDRAFFYRDFIVEEVFRDARLDRHDHRSHRVLRAAHDASYVAA